jgi:hypothetical protein
MTRIDASQHRMQQASDLAAVLDTAYEAFEAMLAVIHPVQDPASDLFTALVMAAASAANGRNALARDLLHTPPGPRPARRPPVPLRSPPRPPNSRQRGRRVRLVGS